MKKLKRILVGMDIFVNSNRILKRAILLAQEHDAKLFIVQAIETPLFSIPDYFSSKNVKIDRQNIKKRIEKKIKKLNSDANVPYSIFIKEGNAADIILYESKLLNAEMIVMGAHTKSNRIKDMLGNTANKVLHQTIVPVLLVKNRVKKAYENIVVPTDFSMQSKQSILFLQEIYPSAKIEVVNAHEALYITGGYTAGTYGLEVLDIELYDKAAKANAQENLKTFMKEISADKGKVIESEFNSKNTLLKYINKGRYDLVFINPRVRSNFGMYLGSLASEIIKEAGSDILIYVQ